MVNFNRNKQRLRHSSGQGGYTLVELVIVVVIIGILAAVAATRLKSTADTIKSEETMAEMEQLSYAIAGNPELVSGGVRSDYGYVGDIGALPPNWDALVINPGGYATWDGPYTSDEFSSGGSNYEFMLDAWGAEYSGPNAAMFSSTGGPETITRRVAKSIDALLYNPAVFVVTDLDYTPPGTDHSDSVQFIITYPDGIGSYISRITYPEPGGMARFDSLPIGSHRLDVVFLETGDTISRMVNVNPGDEYYAEIKYFADIWSGGGTSGGGNFEFVAGSDTLVPDCAGFSFRVVNNSGAPVAVSGIIVTWSSPSAYFKYVDWDGMRVVDRPNPAVASGETVGFSSPRTIGNGESVQVVIDDFRMNINGGPKVDMDASTLTISFSDGTSFEITTGACP